MYQKLFSPITIKGITLRNHVIMPAMGTRFTQDRFVNQTGIFVKKKSNRFTSPG